jgi:hypothetical protein
MDITLQDLLLFSCILCCWVWSYLSYWLVQFGPSCPHAHSILILSLSSTGWTVYRRIHFLPTDAVWLGSPRLGAWLGIFLFHLFTTQLQSHLPHTQLQYCRLLTHIHIILITLIILPAKIRQTCCSQALLSGTLTLFFIQQFCGIFVESFAFALLNDCLVYSPRYLNSELILLFVPLPGINFFQAYFMGMSH